MIKVLLADDHPDIVRLLQICLRDEGHTFLTAFDGAEALRLARAERPDLVISDLRMSGMNGHELQREIKQVMPALPVVIVTAFGSIQTLSIRVPEGVPISMSTLVWKNSTCGNSLFGSTF